MMKIWILQTRAAQKRMMMINGLRGPGSTAALPLDLQLDFGGICGPLVLYAPFKAHIFSVLRERKRQSFACNFSSDAKFKK